MKSAILSSLGLLALAAAARAQSYPIQPIFQNSPSADEWFGFDVDVSGTTAIVGAPGPLGSGDTYTGRARIFLRSVNGNWVPIASLNGNSSAGASFGRSVGIDGDRVVVGAPRAVANGSTLGTAAIFERLSNGTWDQIETLTAPAFGPFTNFGYSIDIEGDRIVVGAPGGLLASPGYTGRAHLFERQLDGSWALSESFENPDAPGPFEDFGTSVGISAPYIAVGGYGANAPEVNSGAAHLFRNAGALGWSAVETLTPSDGDALDEFGGALAIQKDRIVVGAAKHETNGVNTGAVYMFERQGGTSWSEKQIFYGPSSVDNANFGVDLALDGDWLSIAARDAAFPTTVEASIRNYLFVQGLGWDFVSFTQAPGPTPGLSLEPSVALDGGRRIVGFPGDGENAPGAGRAEMWFSYEGSSAVPPLLQGTGSPGCSGTQELSLTKPSLLGTLNFGIAGAFAPPLSGGLMLLGTIASVPGADVLGIGLLLHIKPESLLPILSISSDVFGLYEANIPIPNDPALLGLELHAQSMWFWGAMCTLPSSGFSSSKVLTLTVSQP